jgi:hypothetical protein
VDCGNRGKEGGKRSSKCRARAKSGSQLFPVGHGRKGLLKAVRELHFKDAQWAATDLLGALSHNKGWQSELRPSAADAEEIVMLLDFVNNYLSDYLSDEEVFFDMRDRLAVNCQAIYKKLNEVAGAIDAQVEGL